jgi:predicted DNA-binding protein
MFSKKAPVSLSKSIRVPEEMFNALTELAEDAGETFNSYVVLVLDQYLQAQVKAGKVKRPKDDRTA